MNIKDIRPRGRDVFQVSWPGGRGSVNLLLLRCAEVQEAHFASCERFRKQGQQTDGVSLGEFLREKELQEVFFMLLQPDSKQPEDRLFRSADEARKELDLEEVAFFQKKHAELMDQVLRDKGMLQEETGEKKEQGESGS